MSPPDETPKPPDEHPPTPLAALVEAAKAKVVKEPDRHGPAAVRAMAAVVRDLKGMPELAVTRESGTRLKLARKNKGGWIVLDYDAKITALEVSVGGFSDSGEPGQPKRWRYGLEGETWKRLDGGGDLFEELRAHLVKLYPEIEID